MKKLKLKNQKTSHKTQLRELKEQLDYNMSDLLHNLNLDISNIKHQGVTPILNDRQSHIKFAEQRYKDKVIFIKALAVENYEKK